MTTIKIFFLLIFMCLFFISTVFFGQTTKADDSRPDLIVTSMSTSVVDQSNKILQVTYRLKNGGDAPAQGKSFLTFYYDGIKQNKVQMLEANETLVVGEEKEKKFNITLLDSNVSHILKIFADKDEFNADTDNLINESDESNNTFLLMVSISNSVTTLADTTTCKDTDGGKNYLKAGGVDGVFGDGSAVGSRGVNNDACLSNRQLLEFYCENNLAYRETKDCEFGCVNGVCVDTVVDDSKKDETSDLEVTLRYEPNNPEVNESVEFYLYIKNNGPKNVENIYYSIAYNYDIENDDFKELKGVAASNSGDIAKLAIGGVYTEKSIVSGGKLATIKYPSAGKYFVRVKIGYRDNSYEKYNKNVPTLTEVNVKEAGSVQCTDTDGGNNPYLKGEISLSDGVKRQDQCYMGFYNDEYKNVGFKQLEYREITFCDSKTADGCFVRELSCLRRSFKDSYEKCTGGCKDGACIKDQNIINIENKANLLYENNYEKIFTELKLLRDIVKEQQTEIKYLKTLKQDLEKLNSKMEDAINVFITYGVDENTQKLGEGERAAVISSYEAAFDKLPTTEEELADAIKIANGRFPAITNAKAEQKAKDQFFKIYNRAPDMTNANDAAAVKVMAYGLRQKAENRKLGSETKGIKTFKHIFGNNPKTTEEWNTMQAITYSGASKKPDTDKDGLADETEKKLGTDPNKADSDGDGYKDGTEVLKGYDPLKK